MVIPSTKEVSDCIIKRSKCSKHYPNESARIISYNLSYSCTSSSNEAPKSHWKILVPIFLLAGPLGQRRTSQFIGDMHPSAPFVQVFNLRHAHLGLPSPKSPSRGHPLPHVRAFHFRDVCPHMSHKYTHTSLAFHLRDICPHMSHKYTHTSLAFHLRDICPHMSHKYTHTSLAHPSQASVIDFRFGDLCLGLLFQGQQADHPSWLSDSGTSGSTFRLRDIGLHYPFRRNVLAVRLVAISVGIRLGDIRLCLQSQDQLIYFNHH